jgi:short subunit dehydrogenase-like uncharacterized protein
MRRPHDLLVLGATGFTGRRVCLLLAASSQPSTAWAVAVRTEEGARRLLEELRGGGSRRLPDEVFVGVDVFDRRKLVAVLSTARVVLNCTGPYRFLGAPVVEASIEAATDYLDLCGETQFLEEAESRWGERAVKAGVAIICACGMDSIPADMGVLFVSRCMSQRGLLCSSVESYLKLHTGAAGLGAHFTTFESAVHSFGSIRDVRRFRQSSAQHVSIPRCGPPPPSRATIFREHLVSDSDVQVRFPGCDASVVRLSQQMLAKRMGRASLGLVPHFRAYMSMAGNAWTVTNAGMRGAVMYGLAQSGDWGRRTLLRSPEMFTAGIFSHAGPSDSQLQQTSFSLTLVGRGVRVAEKASPPETLVCRVQGPEPGYVSTPIILLAAAMTVLEERHRLPGEGGVWMPAAAFAETDLLHRLRQGGISFAVSSAPSVAPSPSSKL